MNRTLHEIIVTPDGKPRLRSRIDNPIKQHPDDETTILSQESGLPKDLTYYLLDLINLHEEKLINDIGTIWMGRKL